MYAVGIDIGTTTCSSVVLNLSTRQAEYVCTIRNTSELQGDVPGASLGDAGQIESLVSEQLGQIRSRLLGPIASIGLTGQMHGIVYIGRDGRAVSPLYTWQDKRGEAFLDEGRSASVCLSNASGYPMASGYGLVTHFMLERSGSLPADAACLVTIADYIAMRLCDTPAPLIHASNAAGLGPFNLDVGAFDTKALKKAGIGTGLLPPVTRSAGVLGATRDGIPVSIAIGDNQAGFLGSVRDQDNSILLNIGTSGQISVTGNRLSGISEIQLRPLTDGKNLLVGATLCAGKAYELVHRLIADCLRLAGAAPCDDLYDRMNRVAQQADEDPLKVRTTFSGTRQDPSLRGEVGNISMDNLTAGSLVRGTIHGIVDELSELYRLMQPAIGPKRCLIGSGNAIRNNVALASIAREAFGLPLLIPCHMEEAAFGAALFGAVSAGVLHSFEESRALIRYTNE